MSHQETNFFIQEMADVIPLKNPGKVTVLNTQELSPGQHYRKQAAQYSEQDITGPLSMVLKSPLQIDDWISYKRNGIQTGVFKNLRLGKYPLEATLNLVKKSPLEARDELMSFIKDCQECNIRSVLIVCGKDRKNGVLLKSYLAQWLPELDQVQACHTALTHHGGVGAIYVLMRKSEQQRAENRERHAARLGE